MAILVQPCWNFFPDTTTLGNYGSVQNIKSCDLYFKF
jgi:hypothetical protein